MEVPAIESLKILPYFELEEFMNFARESRLSSEALAALSQLWEEWSAKLHATQIGKGEESWLIIWLPEEIEGYIDDIWKKSPSDGFLSHSLAQYMCMSGVAEALPETANGGCAPLPKIEGPLKMALESLDLLDEASDGSALARKYAILTYFPFKGGCERCALEDHCPQLKTSQIPTYILPGYEKGKN